MFWSARWRFMARIAISQSPSCSGRKMRWRCCSVNCGRELPSDLSDQTDRVDERSLLKGLKIAFSAYFNMIRKIITIEARLFFVVGLNTILCPFCSSPGRIVHMWSSGGAHSVKVLTKRKRNNAASTKDAQCLINIEDIPAPEWIVDELLRSGVAPLSASRITTAVGSDGFCCRRASSPSLSLAVISARVRAFIWKTTFILSAPPRAV